MNRHKGARAREEDAACDSGPPRPRRHHPDLLPDRLRVRGLGDPHPGDQGGPRPLRRGARRSRPRARGRRDRRAPRRRSTDGPRRQPHGAAGRLRRLPGRPGRQRCCGRRSERDGPLRRRRSAGPDRGHRRHLRACPRRRAARRPEDLQPAERPAARPRPDRLLRLPPRRRRLQLERRASQQRAWRRRGPRSRRLHPLLTHARDRQALRRPPGPVLRRRGSGRKRAGHLGSGARGRPRRVGAVRARPRGAGPDGARRRPSRRQRVPRRGDRRRHDGRLSRLVHPPPPGPPARQGRRPPRRPRPAGGGERRDDPPRAEGAGLNLPCPLADASLVSVNDLVLVQGMDDTKRALRRWNAEPLGVVRPWFLLSVAITLGLLLAVYVVATSTTPDETRYLIPGYNVDATVADYLHVLLRNSLVLALHAMACVAGFMAGSSLPLSASHRSGISRWVHEKAGPLAIGFVVCATAFSLCTQAYVIGGGAASIAHQVGTTPGLLLFALTPHALPELIALFMPLAAWIVASRNDDWQDLLAATVVTVALSVPVLLAAAAVETWVSPQLLLVIGS